MTPDEIAEDAFWGAQNQDDTRQHIEEAIEAAVDAERKRIASAIQRERDLINRDDDPYIHGLIHGYSYALTLIPASREAADR